MAIVSALTGRIDTAKYALDRRLRRLGWDLSVLRHGRGYDADNEQTIEVVGAETMATAARINAVCDATRYIVQYEIPGSIVECGVWRGGMMMAAARTLLKYNEVRPLYLYDTFSGMTEPTLADEDSHGRSARRGMKLYGRDTKGNSLWCNASLATVRENMMRTRYPLDQVHFIEGAVEETIPRTVPEQIAILRLDTDWYESTAHELKYLFPLIVDHGVLIIDDYGHWTGSRQAVDEYVAKIDRPLLLNRTDYTGRVAVVPPRVPKA
ncbi:MAG: TylF/MycF/NovP-related O-methyltransferase [Burkholderiales bacterium]